MSNRYKFLGYVLLVTGTLGLLDLATRNIVLEKFNIDIGYVAFGLFLALKSLLGVGLASKIISVVGLTLGLGPLLLAIGHFFISKAQMMSEPTNINQKKLKRAKIILFIVISIVGALILFSIGLAVKNTTSQPNQTGAGNQNESLSNDINLESYLSGVGLIRCWQNAGDGSPRDPDLEASGSLWTMGDNYVVLTNAHAVLEGANLCLLILGDSNAFKLVPTFQETVRQGVDAAVMQILTYEEAYGPEDKRPNLNYEISKMPRCPQKLPLGQPVKIVGYPAFTKLRGASIWDNQTPKTVTEGTISAYYSASSINPEKDPQPNYFVSAKMDSGVSGGAAFSISENKLCLLGIPTWLNIGEYETQGIVQNIHNVIQ